MSSGIKVKLDAFCRSHIYPDLKKIINPTVLPDFSCSLAEHVITIELGDLTSKTLAALEILYNFTKGLF